MDLDQVIALYAAGLSTAIALTQAVNWRLNKPRLEVTGTLLWRPLAEEERGRSRGTPVVVRRGRDDLLEEVLVKLTVRNRGGKPIQISSLLIETVEQSRLSNTEVVSTPLPHTLDPASAIEVSFQKEFLDVATAVSFLGVLDALGRRHGVAEQEARRLIHACWDLPTRIAMYKRRDDPTAQVRAFQVAAGMDHFGLSQKTVAKFPKLLAERDSFKEQPVVSSHKPVVVVSEDEPSD